jgi:peroxiredoxin
MNIICRFAALLFLLGAGISAAAETGKIQTLLPLDKPFAAPDFSLKGEDGKTYRLSDYRGKVVVLNFWATWCPPCRYEMPSMERAHQKVKGEEIVILAVNVGEDENTVFAFTGQYPVSFPLPLDMDGSVIAKYPVIGLPTTFIIDPRGQVMHRAIGGREWDDDRLLDQLRRMLKPQRGLSGESR